MGRGGGGGLFAAGEAWVGVWAHLFAGGVVDSANEHQATGALMVDDEDEGSVECQSRRR